MQLLKRNVLLLAAVLMTLTAAGQDIVYYVNGRKVDQAALASLKASQVASMRKEVVDGAPVIRIELKPGVELLDDAAVRETLADSKAAATADSAAVTRAAQIRRIMREQYEKTTLLRAGDSAADFTVARFAGDSVSLESLRGKVVLLNFWATWCAPCLAELSPERLPAAVLERFGAHPDFVFLPIAYTDSPESLTKFFATERGRTVYAYLRECTGMDPDKAVFLHYATQGVPRSFVIGRDGRIVSGSLGNAPEELERIAEAVAGALGE